MIVEYDISYFPAVFYEDAFFEQRGELFRFQSFKAKINSNEMSGHSRPHTHIVYENVDYVCTIDNVIEVLEPKHVKLCIKKYIVSVMSCMKNLMLAREKWNQCSSHVKFTDEDIYFKSMSVQYDNGKAKISAKN